MVTEQEADAALREIDDALAGLEGRDAVLHGVMAIIARRLPHYNWVGIYFLDGGVLNLGPYIGAATDHTLIPVGQGVCGTAIAEERNQIIPDVSKVENYLSCSVKTRAEIVVLIREAATGQIIGQIDADSHQINAFDSSDEAFLNEIADRIAPRLEKAD